MQLPKHKMGKVPVKKASQRTAKHKKNQAQESEAVHDEVMEEQQAVEEPTNAQESTSTPVVNRLPTKLKSKEEKKAIRKARQTANASKNVYKRRSGGVTAKNGPRAINQVSIITL